MNIKCIICGPVNVNTYVLHEENTNEALIIDPGDFNAIQSFLLDNNLSCNKIILTHGHFDHTAGLKGLNDFYHPEIFIHEKDEHMLFSEYDCGAELFRFPIELPENINTTLLKDNDSISFCGINFLIMHTPGHTTGSICVLNQKDNVLFSGDTVFRYSYGRTDLPFADSSAMIPSLKKIYSLKQDYLIYAGHGPKTSVIKEREYHGC